MNVIEEFQDSARNFIKHCGDKFRWSDASTDVIMDIGCGYKLYCGNAILEEHPEAKAVIGIDKDLNIIQELRSRNTKITCYLADIQKRDTLKGFLGNMTKVFSSRVFQELTDVQTAFQNVFDLLRPGGQAAFLFYSRSSKHEWFVKMINIPKWKDIYQDCFNTDSFLSGISKQQYIEMVQNIGFEVVECSDKETESPLETNFIDKWYKAFQNAFKVPPELLDEFEQEAFHVYVEVCERDAKDRLVDRTVERTLLLVKPAGGHHS